MYRTMGCGVGDAMTLKIEGGKKQALKCTIGSLYGIDASSGFCKLVIY